MLPLDIRVWSGWSVGCTEGRHGALQVLRTRFVTTANGPQQTVLPAEAVSVHSAEIPANGSPLIAQRGAGECELRDGSSLATAWLQAATAPFDLYSEPLVRIHVRLHRNGSLKQMIGMLLDLMQNRHALTALNIPSVSCRCSGCRHRSMCSWWCSTTASQMSYP